MENRLAKFLRLTASRFFPRWTDNSSSSPSASIQPEKENKRVFRRYPIEFDVSITFLGHDAAQNTDQGELEDISGGGAMFRPCQPNKYYKGQQIEATIYLAGTNDVQACVRSPATVVRVDGASEHAGDRPVRVAVQFDRTFDFERLDSSDTGMNE